MTEEIDLSTLSPQTRAEIELGRKMLARKDTKLSPTDQALNATDDPNRKAQILGNVEPPKAVKVSTPDRVPTFAEGPPKVKVAPKTAPAAAAPAAQPGNLAK